MLYQSLQPKRRSCLGKIVFVLVLIMACACAVLWGPILEAFLNAYGDVLEALGLW